MQIIESMLFEIFVGWTCFTVLVVVVVGSQSVCISFKLTWQIFYGAFTLIHLAVVVVVVISVIGQRSRCDEFLYASVLSLCICVLVLNFSWLPTASIHRLRSKLMEITLTFMLFLFLLCAYCFFFLLFSLTTFGDYHCYLFLTFANAQFIDI